MERSNATRLRGGFLTFTFVLAAIVIYSLNEPSFSNPKPDKLTLYEGLPHQLYETEKLVEERKKPNIEKDGFPFYRDPLDLKEGDAELIASVLANPRTFQSFSGEKKCGGFHPDYAVVVSARGEEFTYLVCFGCGEVKVFRPDRSETRYDLAKGANGQRLTTILRSYRKNRPLPPEGL